MLHPNKSYRPMLGQMTDGRRAVEAGMIQVHEERVRTAVTARALGLSEFERGAMLMAAALHDRLGAYVAARALEHSGASEDAVAIIEKLVARAVQEAAAEVATENDLRSLSEFPWKEPAFEIDWEKAE